jgi:nucleoside-diphosphate-sugar epimerase
MPAKVLITGGNGFIGSYTALRLESVGHAVIPIDVVPRSGELSLLPISTSTRILDIAAAEDVRELCRKEKFTHIFHAAHPPRVENPQDLQ